MLIVATVEVESGTLVGLRVEGELSIEPDKCATAQLDDRTRQFSLLTGWGTFLLVSPVSIESGM